MANNQCSHPHTLTLVTASGCVTWCQQCGALHIDGDWQYPHPAHDTERPLPMPTDAGDLSAKLDALQGDERDFIARACLELSRPVPGRR